MPGFGEKMEPLGESEEVVLRRTIARRFEEVGLKETLHEKVFERLVLLEKESLFNEDSLKIRKGMKNVIDWLEKNDKIKPLSEKERSDGQMAALLHDIGKTGPAEASPEEQRAVVRVFALAGVPREYASHPVREVLGEKLGEGEAEKIMDQLVSCGLIRPEERESFSMTDFWDEHAKKTKDILERYPDGTTLHCRMIAASHHVDHGIDPYDLKKKAAEKEKSGILLQAQIIGALETYVDSLEERILMAVDKYEAQIRRSKVGHKEALEWVENDLGPKFKEDEAMKAVLEAIRELGPDGHIFS